MGVSVGRDSAKFRSKSPGCEEEEEEEEGAAMTGSCVCVFIVCVCIRKCNSRSFTYTELEAKDTVPRCHFMLLGINSKCDCRVIP